MSELQQAIEQMRNMRENYNLLANGVITAPIANELESGKAAIVAAINAMGGQADSSMSLGALADAIRALILVQLGELEYDIPIENCEQALNLASTHCTKYVNDYTTNMYTPLIVDEWQAVEEVRYKKLIKYDYDLFSSDERKNEVYALTLCHNLQRITFDLLQSITLPSGNSRFIAYNYSIDNIDMPSCKTIYSGSTGNNNDTIILSELSVKFLSMPQLESIQTDGPASLRNSGRVFSNLTLLTDLSMPKLKLISAYTGGVGNSNYSEIFTNLNSLPTLYLPELEIIEAKSGGSSVSIKIFTNLNNLKVLRLPAFKQISFQGSAASYSNLFTGAQNLEDIEIGHTDDFGVGSITANMRLSGINPTNTYQDATKLAALNQSIRTKWFANLYDYTGGTTHTLTLATAFVSHLDQETIDVATAKNWTIQTV